jgi:Zn-dependent protease with chaperone function
MPNVDFFEQQRLYRASSVKMYWRIFWGIAASTLSLGYLLDLLLTYVLVPVTLGLYCFLNSDFDAYLPAFRFMNSTPVRLWGTVILTVISVRRLVSMARDRRDEFERTGSEFAARLGAVPLEGAEQDRLLRVLQNVVEEMGLASGAGSVTPYVLEGDHGINGIAIGVPGQDVAVIVTRRALDVLDRAELQALVAHVMAYIVHGDIRRDLRVAAWVDTLESMRAMGKTMVSPPGDERSDRGGNLVRFIIGLFGLALLLPGWLGGLFVRSARVAAYRLRERMADAAAIQFTRDPGALVRLLRKIPTTPGESVIHIDGEVPLKHLFFAPIDHAGRQMSELQRTFNDGDRSIRERLEALAPGEDWSRM